MAFIMYYADRGRGALLIVYLISFLFGVFRLRMVSCCSSPRSRFSAMARWCSRCTAFKPETVEPADEILQLIVSW